MKKDIDVKCYELTLTPNYVSDWTFNDALRELIQNGTDQEVLDKENKFQIIYNGKEKTLRLVNQKSVLKINTLLLGRSSKANNEDTVGQFGEGYKIAALVLNRLGKTFTIYNNEKGEIWESRFKNSEKWLEKILAFYVYKHDTDNSGLCIEVGNVTHEEFNNLYKVWLHLENCDYSKAETGYGEIILDEEYAGEVYVNGLFVDCKAYGKSKSEKEAELREQKLQAEIALKESQGEMHRLKTEIASGKYIDIEEVKMDYSRFFVSFKKFALSLPSRLSGRISGHCDPMEIRSIEKDLNAEIIRLLNSFVVAGCTPEEMEKKKRGKKSVS